MLREEGISWEERFEEDGEKVDRTEVSKKHKKMIVRSNNYSVFYNCYFSWLT